MGIFSGAKAQLDAQMATRTHIAGNKASSEGRPEEASEKYAQALRLYQRAMGDKGLKPAFYQGYAMLLMRLGDFAQAKKIMEDIRLMKKLTDDDWYRVGESASTIARSGMIIDDTPGISVAEMRTKCRKFKLDNDIKLIIIDYLQLMSGAGRSDNRTQEVAEISRALKGLARELGVPVIALSQLSRAPEQRPDHRPMMSDLRESGAIEQDADIVMFLYREDYYKKDTDEKNVTEVILAKQRNGPIGTVKLAWLPDFTKFANLSKEQK